MLSGSIAKTFLHSFAASNTGNPEFIAAYTEANKLMEEKFWDQAAKELLIATTATIKSEKKRVFIGLIFSKIIFHDLHPTLLNSRQLDEQSVRLMHRQLFGDRKNEIKTSYV